MQSQSRYWLWPNITGIDAALIAIAWQWIFAMSVGENSSLSAQIVLGLSVWLSYMADRLYDVRSRPIERLLSLRHRFAKNYRKQIWKIWLILLALNVAIALIGLTIQQLMRGSLLLLFCLAYTFLNQRLSKRCFPKECFVALLFAGGAIIFLERTPNLIAVVCFTIICGVNCLILGHKEQAVDHALRVQSLASIVSEKTLWICILCTFALIPFISGPLSWSLSLTLLATSLLYRIRQNRDSENFRAVLDASMLVGLVPWIFKI